MEAGETLAMATHPMLAAWRPHDVRRQLTALQKLGAPFASSTGASPSKDAAAVDELNRHIQQVLSVERQRPDRGARAMIVGLEPVKVRPCVDLTALNEHLAELRLTYSSPDDAAALVRPGFEMARVDLYKAFLQFLLHPEDAMYMAVEIDGKLYVPRRALFGGSPFPHYIFTVMAAIMEILGEWGIPAVVMIDDIFLCGRPGPAPDPETCAGRLARAQDLLVRIGFQLNEDKTLGPAAQLVFKGIQIDSVNGELSIPPDKIEARIEEVSEWLERARWTRRDAKSLLGCLGWVCSVLQAGRPHLARLRHDVNYGMPRHVHQPITQAQKEELEWFQRRFEQGRGHRLWAPFWLGGAAPFVARVFSDASGTETTCSTSSRGRRTWRASWRAYRRWPYEIR